MTIRTRLLANIATLGPVGRLPAPGTAGSLVALVSGLLLISHGGFGMLVIAVVCVGIIGLPACDAHQRLTGEKDAGAVIIDEVAGQWLTLLALPFGPEAGMSYFAYALLGFLFFRIFDIMKPGPVGAAEGLPGAAGVMADDILAGAIAGALIMALGMAHDLLV